MKNIRRFQIDETNQEESEIRHFPPKEVSIEIVNNVNPKKTFPKQRNYHMKLHFFLSQSHCLYIA